MVASIIYQESLKAQVEVCLSLSVNNREARSGFNNIFKVRFVAVSAAAK